MDAIVLLVIEMDLVLDTACIAFKEGWIVASWNYE